MLIHGVEIDLSALENRLPENKIKAIKEVQEKTGASLEEAKAAVDAYVASCLKEPRPVSYCSKCGAALGEGAKFCGVCGASVHPSGQTSGQEWQQAGPNVQSADTGTGTTQTTPDSSKGRKKWKLYLGFAVVILFLILIVGSCTGNDKYIRMVKGSTLYAYDYGVSIGDSLHKWFVGTEQWDSYEDDGDIYVTVVGDCPYALTGTGERQAFCFEIIDKEHFQFLGAFNEEGTPICTDTGSDIVNAYVGAMLDWMSPLYSVDFYEEALKAAFGNEESLEMFKKINSEM